MDSSPSRAQLQKRLQDSRGVKNLESNHRPLPIKLKRHVRRYFYKLFFPSFSEVERQNIRFGIIVHKLPFMICHVQTVARLNVSHNLRLITLFAVHYFRPLWRITCFKFIGAVFAAVEMRRFILIGLLSAVTHTSPSIFFQYRISKAGPIVVAAIKTFPR